MRRPKVPAPALLVAVAALAVASPARAGNGFTFPIGGRAAAMGGAFTAMGHDPGVAWYNPAGLGFVTRSSLDVSASAYAVHLMRIPTMLRTTLPSGTTDRGFSANPFQIVGSSMTYVRKLGGWETEPGDTGGGAGTGDGTGGGPAGKPVLRHALALSVFIPVAEKFARTSTFDAAEAFGTFHQRLSVAVGRQVYYIGPSWGMRIGERWAVGASLYGLYAASEARASFTAAIATPEGTDFGTMDLDATGTELGMAVHLGVQARPVSGLRLGLALRLPGLRVWGRAEGAFLTATTRDDAGNPVPSFADEPVRDRSGAAFVLPFSMTLGIGWESPGVFAIAVDGDYTVPWPYAGVGSRGYFNGRLGVEAFLAPRWVLGFGGFTDVSPLPAFRRAASRDFMDMRLDFYGGTIAVTHLSPYAVVGSDATDRITFATTLGVRYAYGFGRVVGMDLDYVGGTTANALRSITVHDLSVVLASSVRF